MQTETLKKKVEEFIAKRHLVPDEFWVRTDGNMYQVVWFLNRQKPSVEVSYDFDEERFGVTKEGKVIWGFDSGCSCPSPWSSTDFGDDHYNVKEYKEFFVSPDSAFDDTWDTESISTLADYLLLFDPNLPAEKVPGIRNQEIRRYLMKRVEYQNIKNSVNAEIIHTDGTSELLKFKDGDMYVKVKDSSTDREYLLYVANHVKTCKQAIAWTFGLQENEYNPIIES